MIDCDIGQGYYKEYIPDYRGRHYFVEPTTDNTIKTCQCCQVQQEMEGSVRLQLGNSKTHPTKIYQAALSPRPSPEGIKKNYEHLLLAPGLNMKLVYRVPQQR